MTLTSSVTPQEWGIRKGLIMKRFKMSAKRSKRDFSRKASKHHRKNGMAPMRGGIRA